MSDERYRLVFRGEVLEGQHLAVVKKRLSQALKLDEERTQKLFCGKAVVLKRDADTRTAASYQKLFKAAGARLRVLPVENSSAPTFNLAPAGTPVLDPEQRATAENVDIDTSELELAAPGETLGVSTGAGAESRAVPDTHRISVADSGVDLSYDDYDALFEELEIDLDWTLAELGTDLVEMHLPEVPEIDLTTVNFDLAPAGSDLGVAKKQPPPPAPDISHLSVQELPDQDKE